MSAETKGADFTSNLGRIYTIYTGGFVAFVIFIAILERMGVPNHILGYLFVAFTNAAAFSPTDTMPLPPPAKALMTFQAATSMLTMVLVASRAVNILK